MGQTFKRVERIRPRFLDKIGQNSVIVGYFGLHIPLFWGVSGLDWAETGLQHRFGAYSTIKKDSLRIVHVSRGADIFLGRNSGGCRTILVRQHGAEGRLGPPGRVGLSPVRGPSARVAPRCGIIGPRGVFLATRGKEETKLRT